MVNIGETGGPGQVATLPRASPPRRVPSVTRAVQAAQVTRDAGMCPAAPGGTQEARPQAAVPRELAKHVSTNLGPDADLRKQRRHVRRAQRSVLWQTSSLDRVRRCGRKLVAEKGRHADSVTVKEQGGVAHFTGLETCGSIWADPVCSAKIRDGRATEIAHAAAAWHDAGNTVVMIALTFPHDLGMRLASLLPLVSDGFRHLISGREWAGTRERYVPPRPSKRGGMLPERYYPAKPGVRDQLGIAGTIRSMEVTHGEHGWHPHAHTLFFVEGQMPAEHLVQLIAYLRKRWAVWITSQGYRVPHEQHGVDVQICASAFEAGAYIAKNQDGRSVGNEMARADLKSAGRHSRTPFEILDDFRWTGDLEDLVLWHEYEKATKGHQCITWSKGLRQILAVADRTDEELAEEEVGGQDIAEIPAAVWRRIVATPGLDAAVLDAAEVGGLAGINELLARHGVGRAHAPPEQREGRYEQPP